MSTPGAEFERLLTGDELRKARNAFLEQQSDWKGDCQRCGETLRGTLDTIRAHANVCAEAEGT